MATTMEASTATPSILDQPIPNIMDLPLDMDMVDDETAARNAGVDEHGHAMVEQSRLKIEKLSLLGAPRGPKIIPRGPGARFYRQNNGKFYNKPDANQYAQNGYRQNCRQQDLLKSQWFSQQALQDQQMADYDARGEYGRGPGGGYGNRKRRFREDDEYDRRPQRRRYNEESLSARVRKQILAIAESPLHDAEEDIVAIAKTINENFEDEYFSNHISELVPQLALEQPLKIPFVAAIVLHTNQQTPEFVRQVLAKVAPRLQSHLEAGELRSAKLLLRLLGCMQSLFAGEGVFAILEELFNRAVDLQTASSEDAIGLELVKIIMLTIPYILATSAPRLEQKTAELLEKTEIIASAPHLLENLVEPYINTDTAGNPAALSVIRLLHKQLQGEAVNDWELAFIPRLFKRPSRDHMEEELPPSQKHPFPAVTVPQIVSCGPDPILPEVYFSLYADQDVETVPPTTSLAASLLRDTLVDTINILDFNRNVAAKFLIDIDCYWKPGTFIKRATPFDKLKEVAGDTPTWKSEDLAVDAIFSQMFKLPAPEHKMVYYHSLITETCKIAPAAIAPSLGRAIRYLYRNLDVMDIELTYRFLDWFAQHLSNFDFRWKWTEWVNDVNRTPLNPSKAFILGALDKEVRLSFAKRIRETLPEPYHPLIPTSKDNDIPEFKYNSETIPHSAEAKQILSLLKKKAPDSDIQPIIDSIQISAASAGSANPFLASTDAYVTSLCYIGSKSLSHVLSYTERCKDRLLSLPAVARTQIISSVVDYWQLVQPGVAVNIVDKLLNYTILTPASVVEWALGPEKLKGGRGLAESWVFEMVSRTVGKVTGRVRQIVAARSQMGLSSAQVEVLDETLSREVDGMRRLFATIDDALVGVAEGSNDVMLEGDDGGDDDDEGNEKEVQLLKMWGVKWRKVFQRKTAVEENLVGEATKSFPSPGQEAEDEAVAMMTNGNADGAKGQGINGSVEMKEELLVDLDEVA